MSKYNEVDLDYGKETPINQVHDWVWCMQGGHSVPRSQITSIATANPRVRKRICISCQAQVMDARNKIKRVK